MTLTFNEAIKRLGNLAIHHRDDTFPENQKAIELSIEGLKRLVEIRKKMEVPYVATQILLQCVAPLLGETRE